MIRRLKTLLAEWREAREVPAGWDTPEARAELAAILREATAERAALTARRAERKTETP